METSGLSTRYDVWKKAQYITVVQLLSRFYEV